MNKTSQTNFYVLNGEIYPGSAGSTAPLHQIQIYEVLRIERGIPLFVEDHLNRLFNGVVKVNHTLSWNKRRLKSAIEKFIFTSKAQNGNIKLEFYFTKNSPNEIESRFFFIESHYPNKEMYKEGVKCIILEEKRSNPTIKIANSPIRTLANNLIKKHQVYEVLLCSSHRIKEGSKSNLFFIKEDVVYTAPDRMVLSGVMRKKVLEIIYEQKIPLKMKALPIDMLPNSSAAFITGTSPRVLPIKQIGDQELIPGHPIVTIIKESLTEKIKNYVSTYKVEN